MAFIYVKSTNPFDIDFNSSEMFKTTYHNGSYLLFRMRKLQSFEILYE